MFSLLFTLSSLFIVPPRQLMKILHPCNWHAIHWWLRKKGTRMKYRMSMSSGKDMIRDNSSTLINNKIFKFSSSFSIFVALICFVRSFFWCALPFDLGLVYLALFLDKQFNSSAHSHLAIYLRRLFFAFIFHIIQGNQMVFYGNYRFE